jgi:integrase
MADQRTKLTKAAVEAIELPPKGRITVWDTAIAGFGVRVSAGGSKTFILFRRVNGNTVTRTLGRFGIITTERARQDALRMAGHFAAGIDPMKERRRAEARQVTLQQAMDAYLGDRDLKARTERDVRKIMPRYFKDWLRLQITDIRPAMVEDRYAKLVEGKESGAAAKLAFRYLRAILNYASNKFGDDDKPLLTTNPVKRLSVTKRGWTAVRRRRSLVKPTDFKEWFAAVLGLEGIYLAAEACDCLLLIALTGVRPSEALWVTWKGVDFTDGTLTFYDTKNGTDHVLPMGEWLAARLKARREVSGGLLVFSDVIGTPLSETALRTAITSVTAATEIKFMPSDLRRSFSSTAEALDVGPYSMKALLNHTPVNADVTSGYTVVTVDRLRPTMQAIEDRLLQLGGLKPMAEVVPMRGVR